MAAATSKSAVSSRFVAATETTLTGHANWVRGVAFSPDGALLH